jgi:hypothetical protein
MKIEILSRHQNTTNMITSVQELDMTLRSINQSMEVILQEYSQCEVRMDRIVRDLYMFDITCAGQIDVMTLEELIAKVNQHRYFRTYEYQQGKSLFRVIFDFKS